MDCRFINVIHSHKKRWRRHKCSVGEFRKEFVSFSHATRGERLRRKKDDDREKLSMQLANLMNV